MSTIIVKQESIDGGISPTYFGDTKRNQYRIGLGIDPDITMISGVSTSAYKMSNCVMPVGYTKFSSTEIDSYPIWIGAPSVPGGTEYVYMVLANGKLVRYSSTLGSASSIGTVAGSNAAGAAIYNDYIYITGTGASKNDVSRYGPLSAGPALTDGVWTGATLGTQTALTNNTYPTINGAPIPQHWMHAHPGDGQLYFLDFKNNQGMVHVINTTSAGVNNNSAYNVLDLPFGYYPVAITNFGTNIAITAFRTSGTTLRQGNAALFLWDTISETFYQEVSLPDVFATALLNVNGRLYVFTGSATACRVSVFEGGNTVTQVMFFDDGISVLPGAVTSYGDRIYFGARTAYAGDNFYGTVLSLGSKQNEVQQSFHCPVKISAAANSSLVCTAIQMVQQASGEVPRIVAGWGNGSAYGADKFGYDFTGNSAFFRTDIFEIGKRFKVKSIKFNATYTLAAGVREPIVYVLTDNETASTALNGKFGGSAIVYKRPEVQIIGNKNICIEFQFLGNAPYGIQLPIEIELEVFDDQPLVSD